MACTNNSTNKSSELKKQKQRNNDDRHCLVFFSQENSHGIWPQRLIRPKGRFGFEAKYGIKWFECKIEKEGKSYNLRVIEFI